MNIIASAAYGLFPSVQTNDDNRSIAIDSNQCNLCISFQVIKIEEKGEEERRKQLNDLSEEDASFQLLIISIDNDALELRA